MSPIILIDDDEDDLEMLSRAIHDTDPNLVCVTFTDCTVALSHLSDETTLQPACIFIDMHLPKIGGSECLKIFRSMPRLSGVPIAMISDAIRDSDVEPMRQLGADFFFAKSHKVEHYHTIIHTVMDRILS
jgi:CheY-like chemotaxis protein